MSITLEEVKLEDVKEGQYLLKFENGWQLADFCGDTWYFKDDSAVDSSAFNEVFNEVKIYKGPFTE